MDSNRNQIEEIKSRLDIVDIVGKYVQLKQAGKNFSGLCPFHSEKTPSLIVSPELQRYKCFGCGTSGDIFNFVQNIEHIDFPETLEKLAKEAGVKLVKPKENTRYSRLEDINKKAAIFFYKSLHKPQNIKALEYLKKRGITDESIKNFGIGFSSDSKGLLDFIQKETKYSKEELLRSGLFVEKGGKIRSKFFRRIMFPIRSSSGKVIAFTGRVLPDNDFGPKYMNSPETEIYHKKENLYGQYESRQEIRKQDLAIVCEGTTDVISAHQIGIKNIVAPLGTALTKEQLQKLSRLTKNILFLFDNDSAGQQALERGFLLSQELGLSTFAANTAPYKDIDELISKQPKLLSKIIKKRIDTFTYMLTEYIKDKNLSNLQDYQKTVSWVERMLKNEVVSTNRDFYVKKARQIGGIEVVDKRALQQAKRAIFPSGENSLRKLPREAVYIRQLLFFQDIKLPKYHDIKYFQNYQDIYKILLYISKKGETTRTDLLKHFEGTALKQIIEDAIFSFSEKETDPKELDDLYNNIVKDYFARKEKEYNVKIAIAEAKGDQKESEKLLSEYQNLTKEKQKYEQNSKL